MEKIHGISWAYHQTGKGRKHKFTHVYTPSANRHRYSSVSLLSLLRYWSRHQYTVVKTGVDVGNGSFLPRKPEGWNVRLNSFDG